MVHMVHHNSTSLGWIGVYSTLGVSMHLAQRRTKSIQRKCWRYFTRLSPDTIHTRIDRPKEVGLNTNTRTALVTKWRGLQIVGGSTESAPSDSGQLDKRGSEREQTM